MKFDICLIPNLSLNKVVQIAKILDDSEIDCLWIADEIPVPSFRHPLALLTACGLSTNRLKLGTGIMIPYHMHPANIAVFAQTLMETIGDRFYIGLGPGGSQPLRPLGFKVWNQPLAAMRESITIIRQLFKGDTVTLDGSVFTSNQIQLSPSPSVSAPIFLAA